MNIAYDLFLLTFNLSQLHNRQKIIQLFIEGLHEIFKPTGFIFSETAEGNENDTFELKTGYKHYGYIITDIKGSLGNEHIVLLRNSTQMVAVIIDNLEYYDRIEKEKTQLQEFADLKLIELKNIVKDLEDSRSASINLIEDLNTEIEKRKDAERAISKTEKYFRFLIEKAPDGIALIGIDGKMSYASPSAHKIFGYSEDMEVFPDPDESTHPDDLPQVLSTLNELIKDPSLKSTIEYRFKRKDGTWKWIESTFSNHLGEEGINAIIINFRDISDRKNAEKELRESEEKFRNLFEHSPVGKSMTAVDGTINVNKSFCSILGYSEEELSAKHWKEISHPEDTPLTEEIVKSLLEGKTDSARFEKRYFHKSGRVLITDVATYLQRDNAGKPLYFITTVNDITDRKLAEARLMASEERYSLVIRASEHGIWDWNTETNDIFFSAQWKKQVGYEDHEIENNFNSWVDLLHPDERESCQLAVQAYLNNPVEYFVLEFRFRHKDGSYRLIHNKASTVKNEDGKVIRMFGTHTDITESKQAEEKLKENLALLRIAGEVSKLGGWNVMLDENRSYWSDVVAAIHEMPAGYSPLVEDGINFYAPEWRERITKVFTDCAQKGIPYNEEMEIITSSGKQVWIQTIGEAVRDNNGKIFKVQGAFQDITERKRAEKDILEQMDELRRWYEVTLDREGRVLELKQEVNELLIKYGEALRYQSVIQK